MLRRSCFRTPWPNTNKLFQLNEERYQGGPGSEVEVEQSRTILQTTRAQLVDVGVARAQYEHAVAVLVGKAPEEFTPPPGGVLARHGPISSWLSDRRSQHLQMLGLRVAPVAALLSKSEFVELGRGRSVSLAMFFNWAPASPSLAVGPRGLCWSRCLRVLDSMKVTTHFRLPTRARRL